MNWKLRTAGFLTGAGLIMLGLAPASLAGGSGIGTAQCGDINIVYAPTTLWPPNHKPVTITIQGSDTDNDQVTGSTGGVAEPFSLTVTNISDNESDSDIDWKGVGNTASGTDPGSIAVPVQLRAERDGKGTGRIYDITLSCEDEGGTATTDIFVTVPHDRGHHRH